MNDNMIKVNKSKIREFTNKVKDIEGAISLTLGQPDFKISRDIKSAIIEAVNNNYTIYTDNYGLDELRKEIYKYLMYKNIKFKKEGIIITSGSSEGLFSTIATLINKNDKVLIPYIGYPAYRNIIGILGGEVITYKLDENFKVDIKDLKDKLETNNIKLLILSHPSNPTGSILGYKEYIELCDILKSKKIYIVTDEVYECFSYSMNYSIAMNEELIKKVIYIGGFSKMFSATGLRVGFIAGNEDLIKEIIKTHQYNISCANSISQYGILEGIRNNLYFVDMIKSEFIIRKEYSIKRLKSMNLDFVEPEGGFYIFLSIKKFKLKSEEFCNRLLAEQKLACVPGNAFGEGGEGYIRISFCYSLKYLSKAFDSLNEFILKLKNENN